MGNEKIVENAFIEKEIPNIVQGVYKINKAKNLEEYSILIRLAWNYLVQQSPDILNCSKTSLLNAFVDCFSLGLNPSFQQVYLIPYKNNTKGVTEAKLTISYRGLQVLANRLGYSVQGEVLFVEDKADPVIVKNEILVNGKRIVRPVYDEKKQAIPKTFDIVYANLYKDGKPVNCIYLTKPEVDAIKSLAKSSTFWGSFYNEMALKSAYRRLLKPVVFATDMFLQNETFTKVMTTEFEDQPIESTAIQTAKSEQEVIDMQPPSDSPLGDF